MDLSLLLFRQIAVFFIIMFFGFAFVKYGLFKEADGEPLSRLILYIIMPCVVIKSFQMEITPEKMHGMLVIAFFTLLVHLIWIFFTYGLGKTVPVTGVEKATLIYSNSANLVIPLVSAIFGEEYLFYACIYTAVETAFLWTHANALIYGGGWGDVKTILRNPNVLAIFVGMFLFFAGIKLPDSLSVAMESVAGMVGPASMLVMGMLMAGADLSKIMKSPRVYAICAGRLLFYPILIMLLILASGYLKAFPADKPLLLLAVLPVAAPPATIIAQFAVLYNKDAAAASAYNVLAVLLSIITMPLMIKIFQWVFG